MHRSGRAEEKNLHSLPRIAAPNISNRLSREIPPLLNHLLRQLSSLGLILILYTAPPHRN